MALRVSSKLKPEMSLSNLYPDGRNNRDATCSTVLAMFSRKHLGMPFIDGMFSLIADVVWAGVRQRASSCAGKRLSRRGYHRLGEMREPGIQQTLHGNSW